MEIIGLISAVLGLITAIIKRKRIVELRYSYEIENKPERAITIGKRFKRMILIAIIYFIAFGIVSSILGKNDMNKIAVPFIGFFFILFAYQFMAMLILIWAKLWR